EEQVKSVTGEAAHRAHGEVVIGENHDSQSVLRNADHPRGESVNGATVTEGAQAAMLSHGEAEPEAIGGVRELNLPHLGEGCGLEDGSVRAAALGKKAGQKSAEILDCRVQVPRGKDSELEKGRDALPKVTIGPCSEEVALCQPRLGIAVQHEGRTGHSQRSEDVVLLIFRERLT